ncbi:MAG: hypothetical protein PHH28_12960 [Desulfuromonadaceae bacterium]|nr:hypothetical protein [Desulfuromonadaceae bacterium]
MKTIGIALLVVGCILGIYAFQMETTVTTEGKDFGYGISIPSMTVNNLGLMEDRRNKLMIAGVLVLVGAIFTAFGSKTERDEASNEASSKLVKCTYCAEMIQPEAIVCRFCGKDVPEKVIEAVPSEPESLMEKYGITFEADKYIYDIYKYDSLTDAVKYAQLMKRFS